MHRISGSYPKSALRQKKRDQFLLSSPFKGGSEEDGREQKRAFLADTHAAILPSADGCCTTRLRETAVKLSVKIALCPLTDGRQQQIYTFDSRNLNEPPPRLCTTAAVIVGEIRYAV